MILIDDARDFWHGVSGNPTYPTVEWVREWALAEGYSTVTVEDDIIRISNPPAFSLGTEKDLGKMTLKPTAVNQILALKALR